MSSDPITARNRANAQKSTGPKTAEGKAIVAGNARQHGATARPDPGSVAAWLAIILDRPEITPGDLLPGENSPVPEHDMLQIATRSPSNRRGNPEPHHPLPERLDRGHNLCLLEPEAHLLPAEEISSPAILVRTSSRSIQTCV